MLERIWSERNTPPLLMVVQNWTTMLEIRMIISQKIGNQPNSRPSNTTLGHITKGYSIILQKHLFNYVHSSIIVIARTWKQPRCPSVEEWIKKVWNIYTLEYSSAIKKKYDIPNFEYKWMEIENTILSEITQTRKNEYGMFLLISGL